MDGNYQPLMDQSPAPVSPAWLESARRYVPLLILTIVVMTVIIIPFKVLEYGYLPADDALRAAGKAVSGKAWTQILVLDPVYQVDHEFGWDALLSKIHAAFDANPETIVIFSVVSLFVVVSLAAVFWLEYPEAWLACLALAMMTALIPCRFLLGRPFLISTGMLIALLFFWRRFGAGKPKWWMAAIMMVLVTVSVYFHGTWYLWALPTAAFFFAGQFRWGFLLGGCWMAGTFAGSLLTGHPLAYPEQAVKVVLLATGKHLTQRTLATELQPENGDLYALYILGALLLVRRFFRLSSPPFLRDPLFWIVCLSWTAAFRVGRFWSDWGWPALMVLMACDLELVLKLRFGFDSFRRLGWAAGLAAITFLSLTSDVGSRWSGNLTEQYLSAEAPELQGWLPEHGGILYSAYMSLFYQTLYKNPHGDWRYIVGFEPTLMRDEDFAVYHKILWNAGDAKAYTPWVLKMKPADRLVLRGGRSGPPTIPQLEWNYGVSGLWVGRLPGYHTNGVPATVPAKEPMSSLTNSVSAE